MKFIYTIVAVGIYIFSFNLYANSSECPPGTVQAEFDGKLDLFPVSCTMDKRIKKLLRKYTAGSSYFDLFCFGGSGSGKIYIPNKSDPNSVWVSVSYNSFSATRCLFGGNYPNINNSCNTSIKLENYITGPATTILVIEKNETADVYVNAIDIAVNTTIVSNDVYVTDTIASLNRESFIIMGSDPTLPGEYLKIVTGSFKGKGNIMLTPEFGPIPIDLEIYSENTTLCLEQPKK